MAPFIFTKVIEDVTGFKRIQYNNAFEFPEAAYDNHLIHSNLQTVEQYKNQKIADYANDGIKIYPSEYFCPSWGVFEEKFVTDNTHAIHWNQSFLSLFIPVKSFRHKLKNLY